MPICRGEDSLLSVSDISYRDIARDRTMRGGAAQSLGVYVAFPPATGAGQGSAGPYSHHLLLRPRPIRQRNHLGALAELLDRLGIGLLVVEDVYAADEATLEFLLFLACRRPRQVSLVITSCPEDVPPFSVLPLAVEESVRLMGERAYLVLRDGRWLRRDVEEIDVPPTVRDAVLERAERLTADGQAVLRAAAVLGAPVGEDVLAPVTGLPPGRLRAGLCEALGCGLLTEVILPNGSALVSFRHVLASRAVYESIPSPRRRMLHLRAGQALEGSFPPPVARLASHFRAVGDTGKWCRYAEQAADTALAAGDEATADDLLFDLITQASLPVCDMTRLTGKMRFVRCGSGRRA